MKRALGLLAASVIVAAGLAWIVQGASEDANPEKHVRSLLVDTSGEAITPATETTVALFGPAIKGNGLPLRLTFADPAADTYTAAQAVTTARTRVRAVAGLSGLVVSFDGGTTDHLTVLPNTEIEMGLPIGAGVTIAVKRYTAGTAFTHAIMEVR